MQIYYKSKKEKLNTIKIVAFGDSITLSKEQKTQDRWVNIVEEYFTKKATNVAVVVINSGVGGNTSRDALCRIGKDLLEHEPEIVLVELGGNDATPSPEREVSPKEFKNNLATIHNKINEINARMLLLTFPPIIDEWHCWSGEKKYNTLGGIDKFVEQYRNITREYAVNNGLILLDIDKVLRDFCFQNGVAEIILPDGIHLTKLGNQIIADVVIKTFESLDLLGCN